MSERPLSLQRDDEGVLRCSHCGEDVGEPPDGPWEGWGHTCADEGST